MTLTADSRKIWQLSDLILGSDHAHEEIGDEKFVQCIIDHIVMLRAKVPQKSEVSVQEYLGSIIEEDPGESLKDAKFPTCREDIEEEPLIVLEPADKIGKLMSLHENPHKLTSEQEIEELKYVAGGTPDTSGEVCQVTMARDILKAKGIGFVEE